MRAGLQVRILSPVPFRVFGMAFFHPLPTSARQTSCQAFVSLPYRGGRVVGVGSRFFVIASVAKQSRAVCAALDWFVGPEKMGLVAMTKGWDGFLGLVGFRASSFDRLGTGGAWAVGWWCCEGAPPPSSMVPLPRWGRKGLPTMRN